MASSRSAKDAGAPQKAPNRAGRFSLEPPSGTREGDRQGPQPRRRITIASEPVKGLACDVAPASREPPHLDPHDTLERPEGYDGRRNRGSTIYCHISGICFYVNSFPHFLTEIS